MKTEASGPGLLQLYPFFIYCYFDMHLFCVKDISPTTLPRQEGQLSVSGERVCTILVNRLED